MVPVRGFWSTPPRAVFVSMGGGSGSGHRGSERTPDRVMMKEQSVQCVIGCNPDERLRQQELVISVAVWVDLRESLGKHVKNCDLLHVQKTRMDAAEWDVHAAAELAGTHNYSTLAKIARKTAEEGKYFTIEALAEAIARDIVLACDVPRVTVLIDKPEALRKKGARFAAVEITRNREDFFFQGQKPMNLPDLHTHRTQHPPPHSPASTPFSAAASAQLAAELSGMSEYSSTSIRTNDHQCLKRKFLTCCIYISFVRALPEIPSCVLHRAGMHTHTHKHTHIHTYEYVITHTHTTNTHEDTYTHIHAHTTHTHKVTFTCIYIGMSMIWMYGCGCGCWCECGRGCSCGSECI